jgi:hypothetical protein
MGRPRKYLLNQNYFENIDSENKAYILGFIYADGSIYKNYLSIKISQKDNEILNFIKNELNYSGIIRQYKINNNDYVDLTISSNKIICDLIKLGVIKNKTYLSKELPTYNKKYETAFIRGFFDGDGSIYSNNNRGYSEYTICFSGNINILNQIKIILNNYEISSSKIRHRYNNDNSCMLEIRGNKNIEKIYNLFYNNAEFYLKRKKERFNNFMLMLSKLSRRNLSNKIINEIKELYCLGIKQIKIAEIKNMPNGSIKSVIQRLREYGKIE